MHAVNLRNLLGATCRTKREEQYSESYEFLCLFGVNLVYREGASAETGFQPVEEIEYTTRMYRVSGMNRIILEPVPLNHEGLDSRHVYLIDNGMEIYLWNGYESKPTIRSKARFFAENINKDERKCQAELFVIKQGEETTCFKKLLENKSQENETNAKLNPILKDDCLTIYKPKLYKIGVVKGLELLQVKESSGKDILTRDLLETKEVYILDCYTDLFVWFGRKSSAAIRSAALKLSLSIKDKINRPSFTLVHNYMLEVNGFLEHSKIKIY